MDSKFVSPTHVCAVDIGGTKIACGIVTLNGTDAPNVQSVKKVPTNAKEGGKQVLATVLQAIREALARAEELDLTISGVGISSAGVVDPRTGDITYANELMPGWGGTDLGSAVTSEFGLPCSVLNDVHAHALGEARHGAGHGKDSVLTVAVGTGIGGAFVNHGILMLGAHDEAGHI
ncbi:MAG: ROK family protein, partial [Atopobium sp.]|nr:ROK family protein [Atopobium sp.]